MQFTHTSPTLVQTTLSLAADGVDRIDTGHYRVTFWPQTAGLWRYSWNATGDVAAYEEGEFEVEVQLDPSAGFRTRAQLIQDVRDELGALNSATYTDLQIERYLNDGLARLEVYRQQSTRLAWFDGAEAIALPADLYQVARLEADRDVTIPAHDRHGGLLLFRDPGRVRGGSMRLDYLGRYPRISTSQPCALPEPGASGLVAYATYRILKREAARRADYTQFSTQMATNAVTSEDIERLAEVHRAEFEDVKAQLEFVPDASVGLS